MVLPHGTGDLYHKYRPRRFNEVVGHKEVISSIKKAVLAVQPSQAFLLVGDSGTGKTTTARIMALTLNCETLSKEGEPCLECGSCTTIISGHCTDITEVNAADHRGIGDIRMLCRSMPMMPLQLRRKVFILDEAHQLTNDAQSSLLKELEEAPEHVFIILCSTHPKKILPTVKNRCQQFKFSSLRRSDMLHLLEDVATYEGENLPTGTYKIIADCAGGSPRNGLVKLQQVIQMGPADLEAVARLLGTEDQKDANVFKLCFALKKERPDWSAVSKLYQECKHLGPPAIGMMVAGYFRNQLLKESNYGRANKAAGVLELFVTPFPDGKLGENILVCNLFKATKLR